MSKKFGQYGLKFGILLSILTIFFGVQAYLFLHAPLSVDEHGYVLMIPPGTSVKTIAERLSQERVMGSHYYFLMWVRSEGVWNQLKAGEYLIKSGTTPIELMKQLQQGRVIQHAVTIVPGWTFEQLRLALRQTPILTQTLDLLNADEIMRKLGHPGEDPEGRFFPETYYFPRGTTDVAFLKRAYQLMQEKLASAWERRDVSVRDALNSPYEALILASIIEKESGEFDEYSEISGVFIRRLQKGMPLQADPTLIYGAGKNFTGNLNQTILKMPSPYNTYQNKGLPLTPIALPSVQALNAALNPKIGNTLYFVAKDKGKGHVFSETLEAHQMAVDQYRKSRLEAP